jgi:hypothetical protein
VAAIEREVWAVDDIDSKRLRAAARRGIDWVVGQQREDGSFGDPQDGIGAYYKTPYALAVAGCHREAQRLIDWAARHHFTPAGDFRAPERKARESFHETWPVYANAWLVQGAHRLGRWDLALRGGGFLLRYQTPSGGFYALDRKTPFLEPVCTSWGGLAMLATGRIAPARRAGDLLVRLVAAQPDPGRFYFRMDVEGRLLTEVPAGSELFYYVDAALPKQIYFNPGIALIYLAHLYRATGEKRYLDAGGAIFHFTQRCADDVYRFPPSGKLGLGCALLYALTGLPDARRAAVCVGDYLVETQTAEGFWRLPEEKLYASIQNKESVDIYLDLCSEFSTFLMEMASFI